MTGHIPLGGIKFSEEMALVALASETPLLGAEVDILHALAGNQVTLFYLSMSCSAARSRVSFCVLPAHAGLAEQLATTLGGTAWACRTTLPVGLLTFFPHDHRLQALTRSLDVFAASGVCIYGVTSTLSSLTFVMPFAQLDRAEERLRDVFELPDHHSPFAPEFRVKPMIRSS